MSGDEVALALVDGARRLLLGEMRSNALPWKPIGSDGSLRFSPALAAFGDRWAAAWPVEGVTLRVRGALIAAGEVVGARELRPEAGGSAAQHFRRRRDARLPRSAGGVSVAHRARVSERGFADPVIARPLNLVAEPPEITVVRAGGREWIAGAAVGSVATSAVGLAHSTAPHRPSRWSPAPRA